MHVIPVNIIPAKNNSNNYSFYGLKEIPESISFTQKYPVITSHSKFRDLGMKFKLPCIYCNRPLVFDCVMINRWQKEGLFNGSIKNFVKVIKPYTKSLHETERKVFNIICNISKVSPNAELNQVIKILSIQSNKKLLSEQMPVFKKLLSTVKELPPEYQRKINELVKKSLLRMKKIPHVEEFSITDFNYKIKKNLKTLGYDKSGKNIRKLCNLLSFFRNDTEEIDSKTVAQIKNVLYPLKNKPNFVITQKQNKSSKYFKLLILNGIRKEAENYSDIVKLCDEGKKQIEGVPVIVKFSNKSFAHDLNNILSDLDNNEIKSKIWEIVKELPSSSGSVHAFITKHDNSSSKIIGQKLLEPSIITVEHMMPLSEGGKDSLSNWAYSCKKCNNDRQSKDMSKYYSVFDVQNAHRYWNEIVNLCHKGYFSFKDTVGMFKIFKRCCGISPQSDRELKFIKGIND